MTNVLGLQNKRRCGYCHEIKPLTEFFASKTKRFGKQHTCKVCQNYLRGLLQKRPEEKKKRAEKDLAKRYGITSEQLQRMIASVGGVCEICQKPPSRSRLFVDHCHSSQRVRGLLCSPCNLGLGGFKDDVENLRRAIQYLVYDLQMPDRWENFLSEKRYVSRTRPLASARRPRNADRQRKSPSALPEGQS
jgi:hypothetical protein